uniref:Uncharacterized protein n=1 Tax=Nelumbo nucifera TaxID=4432 RepID=A0A822XS48_NELNU|nr:TPA_asm: hypothetical protein HUJ06_024285 [Nelumbo nucifera]
MEVPCPKKRSPWPLVFLWMLKIVINWLMMVISRHQPEGSRHKESRTERDRENDEADLYHNPKWKADETRINNESKALKLFHTGLMDFVKELAKF